ncbi:MAG: LuxR C-terminal-related transcriptional regulator [Nitrospira sp.]|nr:LuxR C-terminal-related transcriptional regulator [Nitrospira sp.]
MARERLAGKDFRHVLEFIHELYIPRDSDTFTTHLVSALLRLVPADVQSYNEVNAVQHLVAYKLDPEDFWQVPNANEILTRYLDQHPFVQHVAQTGDGSPRTFSDFVPMRQFKNTDLYQEFYGPMRIPHNLFMDVRDRDTSGTTVTLGAHRGGREFAERDRMVLTLIRPHIRQALANAHLTTRLAAENSMLQQVITDQSMSVVTLTAQQTILWGMPRALTLLKQVRGWNPHRPDQLPPVILDWIRSIERGFDKPKELQSPCTPLELDCSPTRARLRLLRKGNHRILVIEETGHSVTPDELASLGLTNREAEVLSWVVQGKTNEEIGHILGCHLHTVKKHLERIYMKLGVENRTAAAMMAADAARTQRLSTTVDS